MEFIVLYTQVSETAWNIDKTSRTDRNPFIGPLPRSRGDL